MKERKTQTLLFLTGGIAYPVLEIVWRGHTHYSMALAGGICLCGIHEICNRRMKNRPLIEKCLAGAGIITGVELAVGVIFNGVLKMQVWDYSALPLNLFGQVCLPFSLLWALLTLPAMGLCALCDSAVQNNQKKKFE